MLRLSERTYWITISKSFGVALPMLNIIKSLFLMTWQLYKHTTGKEKKKTMNKTIRLSYISITCIPKIETPTNGTEKDLRKKKENIYEIKK